LLHLDLQLPHVREHAIELLFLGRYVQLNLVELV
jgi:hypothetical protein